MVETFIIDWTALLLIGVVFGGLGPARRWWRSRAFFWGLAAAGSFTLVAMLSYAVAPDWMWMYFVDPTEVAWAVPFVPPAYLFTYVLGYAAAVGLRQIGAGALTAAGVGLALGQAGVMALTWERYHLVGSAPEWRRGRAQELFSAAPAGEARTIGMISLLFVAVLVLGLYLTYRERGREAAADR